jgi:hypothetical protein
MDKELTPNDYLQWWSDPITKEIIDAIADRSADACLELIQSNARDAVSIKGYQKTIEEMAWITHWIDDKIKPEGGEDDSNG